MTDAHPQIVSLRNHLAPAVRLRKGLMGIVLLPLCLYLLFGIQITEDSPWIFLGLVFVAFLAFGFGWTNGSQGLMGWSNQTDFDFQKNIVSQKSASVLGRSRPFVVPFNKITEFDVVESQLKSEDGQTNKASIKMKDGSGRVFLEAGSFQSRAQAEQMVSRISDAVAMAYQQEQAEQS